MKRLRYWVQKVLPLVYDDSLSYYELLNKVVWKINEMITAIEKMQLQVEDIYDINITSAVSEILTGWLEDGTLERLIDETLNHPEKVMIYSFPCADATNTNEVFGDCVVVDGDVKGIVDLGWDASVYALRNKLTELGITKLDFVIISHYHNDHCTNDFGGALANLIGTGIDFSDCTFYLPHKGINWGNFVGNEEVWSARETAVKSALTTNGIRWVEPSNMEEVQLTSGIKLRFSNIGDYTDYYSYMLSQNQMNMGHTMYNAFSMVAELIVYDRVILFAGDITAPAQRKLAGLYKNVEVYKIEHHGLEQYCPPEWCNSFNATVTLLCNYSRLYLTNGWRLLRPSLISKANQGSLIAQSKNNPVIEVAYEGTRVIRGLGYDYTILGMTPRQMLQEGTDLNDVRDPGEYCSYNQAMTLTMDNIPCDWAGFTLEVTMVGGSDGGGRIQKFYPNSTNVNGFWIRYITTNNVGNWRYVDTTDYIIDTNP